MPVLEQREKDFLERICAVSRLEKSTIVEVLKSILMVSTIEIHAGRNNINIPYICELDIDYHDKITSKGMITQVNLTAKPNRGLIDEISHISEGEETPTERQMKNEIKRKFKIISDVELDEDDE